MNRYPEEEAIYNKIFTVTKPLEKIIKKQGEEIKHLRGLVLDKQNEYRSDIIEEISKSIPLYTRFKVFLEMAHLNLMVEPDTPFTDEEMDAADKWAKDKTLFLLKQLKEWEDDGRPKKKRKIPNVPPEERSKLHEGHDSPSKVVHGYGNPLDNMKSSL